MAPWRPLSSLPIITTTLFKPVYNGRLTSVSVNWRPIMHLCILAHSSCTIFSRFYTVTIICSCYTIFMLHFFLVALFSCCTNFMLFFFKCCTIFLCCTISCWTFLVVHPLHVALSCVKKFFQNKLSTENVGATVSFSGAVWSL